MSEEENRFDLKLLNPENELDVKIKLDFGK